MSQELFRECVSFGGRVCLKSNLLGKGRIWPRAGHLLWEDGEKDGQVNFAIQSRQRECQVDFCSGCRSSSKNLCLE